MLNRSLAKSILKTQAFGCHTTTFNEKKCLQGLRVYKVYKGVK